MAKLPIKSSNTVLEEFISNNHIYSDIPLNQIKETLELSMAHIDSELEELDRELNKGKLIPVLSPEQKQAMHTFMMRKRLIKAIKERQEQSIGNINILLRYDASEADSF